MVVFRPRCNPSLCQGTGRYPSRTSGSSSRSRNWGQRCHIHQRHAHISLLTHLPGGSSEGRRGCRFDPPVPRRIDIRKNTYYRIRYVSQVYQLAEIRLLTFTGAKRDHLPQTHTTRPEVLVEARRDLEQSLQIAKSRYPSALRPAEVLSDRLPILGCSP